MSRSQCRCSEVSQFSQSACHRFVISQSLRPSANPSANLCPRPAAGSVVQEPEDLRSQNGVLEAELTVHNVAAGNGSILYCYTDASGHESPNLRVAPGDLVILHLKKRADRHRPPKRETGSPARARRLPIRYRSLQQQHHESSSPTNLHFHGLTIPPVCHQDDVLKTSVQPGDAPFEYRFRIPENEPPGLYWYHPHIHGFGTVFLGGASGALIVEGIERAKKATVGRAT